MPQVQNDGIDIHYDVRGSGPALMLVAGTGYSGRTWHPAMIDRLSERYTVITSDHRGTGDSTRESPEPYTTTIFARDALAVLRAAGPGPAHLVGHSMGGRVAQQIYFEEPAAVRCLVMAASGAGAARAPEFDRIGVPIGAAEKMINFGYHGYIRLKHRENFFTEAYARDHADEVEWLDEAYVSSAPSLRDYLRHIKARQAHSTVARFGDIDAPMLILVGTDDHAGSASHVDSARAMAALLPRAEFVFIDGARHGIMWEHRDRTMELIDGFLSRHDPDTTR